MRREGGISRNWANKETTERTQILSWGMPDAGTMIEGTGYREQGRKGLPGRAIVEFEGAGLSSIVKTGRPRFAARVARGGPGQR